LFIILFNVITAIFKIILSMYYCRRQMGRRSYRQMGKQTFI